VSAASPRDGVAVIEIAITGALYSAFCAFLAAGVFVASAIYGPRRKA
jgi:hypothetical protein